MVARFLPMTRSLLLAVGLVSLTATTPLGADELPPGWPGQDWDTTDIPALGEGWFNLQTTGARYSEDDGTYYGQQGAALWDTLWDGSPPDHWPAQEEVFAAFASLIGGATGSCDTYCGGDTDLATIEGSDYPWQMYWYDNVGNVTIPWDHYDALNHDPLGHACLRDVFYISATTSCQTSRWQQSIWAYGDMMFGDMETPTAWYSAQTDDCDTWFEEIDNSTTIYYEGGGTGLFVDSVLGLPIAKLAYYDPICSVTGENCSNGVDDDADGYTDCDDCECFCDDNACPDNECDECDDSTDNDGDGYTDCDDPDCYLNDVDCSISVQGEGVNGYVAGFMYAWPIDNGSGSTLVEVFDESITYAGTCGDERCNCSLRNVDVEGADAQRAKDKLRLYPQNYDLKVFYGITHGDDAGESFAGDTVSVLTNDFNMLWQAPAEMPATMDLQLVGVGGTPPCLQCVEHRWDWGMWAYAGLEEFCAIFEALAPEELCGYYHKMDSNDRSGAVSYSFFDIDGLGSQLPVSNNSEIGVSIGGFDVGFYGSGYNRLTVGANGAILMGCNTGNIPPGNTALPTAVTNCDDKLIAPLWDQYRYDIGGEIWLTGAIIGGQYGVIVQWEDVVPNDDVTATTTFQVFLYDSTEEIDFHYQTVSDGNATVADGASATVGVQESAAGGSTEYCYTNECPDYMEDELTVVFYHL
jgi:hypothetical protein